MQLLDGYMTLNAGKCHFMCLGKDTSNETFIFKNFLMNNSKEHKILGVAIDNKLNCKSHIMNYVKKPHKKHLSKLSEFSITTDFLAFTEILTGLN